MDVKIELSRDSVCMGDDAEDHTKKITISLQQDTIATIFDIAKKYLPTIAGHGHAWSCYINNEIVAAIKGNCVEIRPLFHKNNLKNGGEIYFKYHSSTY